MRRPCDESDVPLHHKTPFGAGLKHRRVEFVRATEREPGSEAQDEEERGRAASDLYASIFLGGPSEAGAAAAAGAAAKEPDGEMCAVCALPVTPLLRQHEASLAHSHPPAALDRARMGLRTLQAQGWDPDARRGLGAAGQGERVPVKARAKHDLLSVGASPSQAPSPAPRRPSAKEARDEAARAQMRAEWLQAELFRSVDVERYLRGE